MVNCALHHICRHPIQLLQQLNTGSQAPKTQLRWISCGSPPSNPMKPDLPEDYQIPANNQASNRVF